MKLESLDNLITIISGYAFKSTLFNDIGEGLPLIRVRDVNSKFAGIYYSGEYDDVFVINDGDLLIGLDGDFKCIEWKNGKALLNQRVCKIIPNSDLISRDYLLHYLPSALNEIHRNTNFTTVKHLSVKKIKEIQIPLPNINDQIRIASILTQVETLIQQRKESIDLLDEFVKSTFIKMFVNSDYTLVKLDDITNKITDGEHKKPLYKENGIPFISVVNISKGFLNFDNCKYISEEDHIKFNKRCNPEFEDIIYTKVGSSYGRAVINDSKNAFSLYVSVALIKPKKELVNPYFLTAAINHPFVKRQADKSIKGAGVPDLHLVEIKSFKIPLPPLNLQNQFATIVEKTEALKSQFKASLNELDNLFMSLSQKAFKGELLTVNLETTTPTKIRKLVEKDKPKTIGIDQLLTPQMQEFIRKTDALTKMIPKNPATIKLPAGFDKIAQQIELVNKIMAPFEKMPKLPDVVVESMKSFESMKSISHTLSKNLNYTSIGKTDWTDLLDKTNSNWLILKDIGSTSNIEFNDTEGMAVFEVMFSKKENLFSFKDFEIVLDNEKFEYTYKSVKQFFFKLLEEKKIAQVSIDMEMLENELKLKYKDGLDRILGRDDSLIRFIVI